MSMAVLFTKLNLQEATAAARPTIAAFVQEVGCTDLDGQQAQADNPQDAVYFGSDSCQTWLAQIPFGGTGIVIEWDQSPISPAMIQACDRLCKDIKAYYGAIGRGSQDPQGVGVPLSPEDFPDPAKTAFSIDRLYDVNYLGPWHSLLLQSSDEIFTAFLTAKIPGDDGVRMRLQISPEADMIRYPEEAERLLALLNEPVTFAEEINGVRQSIGAAFEALQSEERMRYFHRFVQKYEKDFSLQNRIPRPRDLRPMRLCSRDIVMAAAILGHDELHNALQVQLCELAEIPEFEDFASAKGMVQFFVTEAYRNGGSLEIRFLDEKNQPFFPQEIIALAESCAIQLSRIADGVITREESIQLMLETVNLSEPMKDLLREKHRTRQFNITGALAAIAKGTWSNAELEHILTICDTPEALFDHYVDAENWVLYNHLLSTCRQTILGGYIDNFALLSGKETADGIIIEDNYRRLSIAFEPETQAKIYTLQESLSLPFGIDADGRDTTYTVAAGETLALLIRHRGPDELKAVFREDLAAAIMLKQSMLASVGILLTLEFEELDEDTRNAFCQYAKANDVWLLVFPETFDSLNAEAIRRLDNARIVQQGDRL